MDTTHTDDTELIKIARSRINVFVKPFQTDIGENKQCASRDGGTTQLATTELRRK